MVKTCTNSIAVGVIIALTLPGCGRDQQDVSAGSGLPTVVGAKALSRHYIEVEFSRPVSTQLLEPSAFNISNADGETLKVVSADPRDGGNLVLLTTEGQRETAYSLQVEGSSSEWVVFGSSVDEPVLLSAVPLNNTQVLLSFDQNLDADTAQVARVNAILS